MNYNKKIDLQKNMIEEHKKFAKLCQQTSIDSENDKNKFLQHKKLADYHNNKFIDMNFNAISDFKQYGEEIKQRILLNKTLSREAKLKPIFITNTLPSKYHPFVPGIKGKLLKNLPYKNWEINPNFEFDTILESCQKGSKELNNFYRTFYLKIKQGNRDFKEIAKNIKFDYILEYHKAGLIPHSHYLLYVPNEMLDYVEECFNETINELGFKKRFNKLEKIKNIEASSKYIFKYISKSITKSETQIRQLDGWRKLLKIRLYKSSDTDIGIDNYRKIYKNMSEEDKQELLKLAKDNNTCLLYEIQNKTSVYKRTLEIDNSNIKHTQKVNDEVYFNVTINRDKKKRIKIDTIDFTNQFLDKNEDNEAIEKILTKIDEWQEYDASKMDFKDSKIDEMNEEIKELQEQITARYKTDDDNSLFVTLYDRINYLDEQILYRKEYKYYLVMKEYLEQIKAEFDKRKQDNKKHLKHYQEILKNESKANYVKRRKKELEQEQKRLERLKTNPKNFIVPKQEIQQQEKDYSWLFDDIKIPIEFDNLSVIQEQEKKIKSIEDDLIRLRTIKNADFMQNSFINIEFIENEANLYKYIDEKISDIKKQITALDKQSYKIKHFTVFREDNKQSDVIYTKSDFDLVIRPLKD